MHSSHTPNDTIKASVLTYQTYTKHCSVGPTIFPRSTTTITTSPTSYYTWHFCEDFYLIAYGSFERQLENICYFWGSISPKPFNQMNPLSVTCNSIYNNWADGGCVSHKLHLIAQPLKLIQYVRTRRNSVYDMFNRLNKLRWPIVAILSDKTVTKPSDAKTLEMRDEHWTMMAQLVPVLEPLKVVTALL